MITLQNVSKSYPLKSKRKLVLDSLNVSFCDGVNTGILGLNGAGKSTLMRILCGSERPDKGTVTREGRISFPIGFSGSFHGSLTGRENLRFTCRIYGADINKVTKFVADFSELGTYLDMPVKTYSSGMKSRLAFGLSMSIGFDFYLIDEGFSVGDASFQQKAESIFTERKKHTTLLVVSHSMSTIKKNCEQAMILINGKLHTYETLAASLAKYKELCNAK